MKIVCDACQAKYSISDDKVQGKVFKIRCKKCSNIIVVRGGGGAAEPAPAPRQEKDTRVYDYGYEGGDHAPAGDESVWHVVINQDQVGPMTAVEVQQRFSSGELDGETYIWREGFADWLPLAQVDTFAGLVGSGGAPAASHGGGAEAVASMFGGGEDAGTVRSDPGDLFSTAAASPAADDDGGDLFGSKPAAASSQSGSKLRGERNENSVLFSLNNLAQLASDRPASASASSSMPASQSSTAMGAATGGAGGEGSGLIDIRSMASAYLGGPAGGPAKPASAGIGSIDDLPVFGGGGFTEPAVIVPISARPANNKLMYALIGSVGLLAVAAVVVVVVLLKGGGDSKPAATQVASAETSNGKTEEAKPADTKPEAPKPSEPAAAPPSVPAATGGDSKPAAPAREVKPAEVKPPEVKPAEVKPAKVAKSSGSSGSTKPTRASEKPDKPAAPVKETPAAAADSGGCDEVSCVLNNYEGACCAKFRKGGRGAPSRPAAGGGGDLPESLDRAMISEGVSKVKPRVMGCGEKSSAKGMVKVSVKVGGDGRVTSVTVKDTPDASLGSCVASAMQRATFARTQTGGSFAYPFNF